MVKLQTFTKNQFTQDEIVELFVGIIALCYMYNIQDLDVLKNTLQNKIDAFMAMIHPVLGSKITAKVVQADEERDQLLVGFGYYIEFAKRHTDPEMVEAANEIDVVLNTTSYKHIYADAYIQETTKINNLLQELFEPKHAAAITTLNIGFYLTALQQANANFRALYHERVGDVARTYTKDEIREARNKMENMYDVFRGKLVAIAEEAEITGNNTLMPNTSGMGGGTTNGGMTGGGTGSGTPTGGTTPANAAITYDELFAKINNLIANAVEEAKRRHNAGKNNENGSEGNESENGNANTGTNTNEGGEENNGEENGSENTNTDNTDPNQGEDNTPSANA